MGGAGDARWGDLDWALLDGQRLVGELCNTTSADWVNEPLTIVPVGRQQEEIRIRLDPNVVCNVTNASVNYWAATRVLRSKIRKMNST